MLIKSKLVYFRLYWRLASPPRLGEERECGGVVGRECGGVVRTEGGRGCWEGRREGERGVGRERGRGAGEGEEEGGVLGSEGRLVSGERRVRGGNGSYTVSREEPYCLEGELVYCIK